MAVEDFFQSKTMMTPGIAASAITVMTGTLVQMFSLPGDLTAMALSFVLGALVWTDRLVPFLQRAVIYLVSSLTIFATAVGLNEAGVTWTQSRATVAIERSVEPEPDANIGAQAQTGRVLDAEPKPFFQPWL